MTFDPHPSHLFGEGENKVGYITQYPEKVRLLAFNGHRYFVHRDIRLGSCIAFT